MNQKQFYRSEQWESFRKVIIAERTDKDGFVHCAHCGKPILHKYSRTVLVSSKNSGSNNGIFKITFADIQT